MKKHKVYVTRAIPKEGIELLSQTCEVQVNPHDRPLTQDELFEAIADADGVIGLLSERIDGTFFNAAPKLKGYANYAVGFDNIDVEEATRRGVPVSNTPDVLTIATAEMAWALLFSVCRHIPASDKLVRNDSWKGWSPLQFIGAEVTGKTLGIVGAGRIGRAMAQMSKGFNMKVFYFSRTKKPDFEKALNAKKVELNELLTQSDFISLHTPLTPETRHMFNADSFKKMKNTAYLINTARGPVVDESALVEALKSGEIAGAGLDVYEFEPKLTPGLRELDNVVLAAHTGSATDTARSNMALLAAKNLLAMLEGGNPPTCLNPQVLTYM
ncbi:2-hydroxyacid dehydrogenase [Desulfatibacillum aliphaticivorans]|uniref:2-hydroxyacid dehydrogenase n=1 Tax=Desulfatibacillum aliphaticivorans TaxID=218208 RepID=UPI00041707CA|nr:D-glycerate dehydrogenase [Desulfatibacillum aliphaticivorans]